MPATDPQEDLDRLLKEYDEAPSANGQWTPKHREPGCSKTALRRCFIVTFICLIIVSVSWFLHVNVFMDPPTPTPEPKNFLAGFGDTNNDGTSSGILDILGKSGILDQLNMTAIIDYMMKHLPPEIAAKLLTHFEDVKKGDFIKIFEDTQLMDGLMDFLEIPEDFPGIVKPAKKVDDYDYEHVEIKTTPPHRRVTIKRTEGSEEEKSNRKAARTTVPVTQLTTREVTIAKSEQVTEKSVMDSLKKIGESKLRDFLENQPKNRDGSFLGNLWHGVFGQNQAKAGHGHPAESAEENQKSTHQLEGNSETKNQKVPNQQSEQAVYSNQKQVNPDRPQNQLHGQSMPFPEQQMVPMYENPQRFRPIPLNHQQFPVNPFQQSMLDQQRLMQQQLDQQRFLEEQNRLYQQQLQQYQNRPNLQQIPYQPKDNYRPNLPPPPPPVSTFMNPQQVLPSREQQQHPYQEPISNTEQLVQQQQPYVSEAKPTQQIPAYQPLQQNREHRVDQSQQSQQQSHLSNLQQQAIYPQERATPEQQLWKELEQSTTPRYLQNPQQNAEILQQKQMNTQQISSEQQSTGPQQQNSGNQQESLKIQQQYSQNQHQQLQQQQQQQPSNQPQLQGNSANQFQQQNPTQNIPNNYQEQNPVQSHPSNLQQQAIYQQQRATPEQQRPKELEQSTQQNLQNLQQNAEIPQQKQVNTQQINSEQQSTGPQQQITGNQQQSLQSQQQNSQNQNQPQQHQQQQQQQQQPSNQPQLHGNSANQFQQETPTQNIPNNYQEQNPVQPPLPNDQENASKFNQQPLQPYNVMQTLQGQNQQQQQLQTSTTPELSPDVAQQHALISEILDDKPAQSQSPQNQGNYYQQPQNPNLRWQPPPLTPNNN